MRVSFAQLFPPPRFLAMPSVGIDVSDTSVKFVELIHGKKGTEVGRFGEMSIPEGVVTSGKITDPDGLVAVLTQLRQEHNIRFVRATLPEEQGYLFETTISSDADDVKTAIEFVLEENVPLTPSEAVIGYDLVGAPKKRGDRRAVVSVFPYESADRYAGLFHRAGLVPLSLEIEPQAIARAVLDPAATGSTCIVDIGRGRSGLALASGRFVRFATTLSTGGDAVTEAIQAATPEATPEEIVAIKNDKGVSYLKQHGTDALEPVTTLAGEILRYITYWNTHDDTVAGHRAPVSKVILCGGNANIAGLPEMLAQQLKVPTSRANVWRNILSLDTEIPPIHFRDSLGFAPAIGLALRSVSNTDPLFFN